MTAAGPVRSVAVCVCLFGGWKAEIERLQRMRQALWSVVSCVCLCAGMTHCPGGGHARRERAALCWA